MRLYGNIPPEHIEHFHTCDFCITVRDRHVQVHGVKRPTVFLFFIFHTANRHGTAASASTGRRHFDIRNVQLGCRELDIAGSRLKIHHKRIPVPFIDGACPEIASSQPSHINPKVSRDIGPIREPITRGYCTKLA